MGRNRGDFRVSSDQSSEGSDSVVSRAVSDLGAWIPLLVMTFVVGFQGLIFGSISRSSSSLQDL